MPDLTIAIACGPAHEAIVQRAVESCKAQTAAVKYGVYPDVEAKGTGWARNKLLSMVQTPFVAFLDADDYLEPTFAEKMLSVAYENSSRYVYCGWYDEIGPDGNPTPVSPPDKCYCFDNGWLIHPVTAVIPTAWAREVGGFDETLPGMEDTDFFLNLTGRGHCGIRVDEPLFHWQPATPESRSFKFRNHPSYWDYRAKMGQKYNKGTAMPCCGSGGVKNEGPFGEKQEGDILAHMLGTPQLSGYVGWHTRRIYKSPGYGALVWAHPADVQRDPKTFAPAAPPQAPQIITSAPAQPTMTDMTPVTTTEQLAAVFEGYARDGNDVYLPQNEAPKTPVTRRATPSDIRRMAGL